MAPRVLVTQFMKKADFSKAEKFGEVIFMTSVEHKPEPTPENHNKLMGNEIMSDMSEYIQGVDFILLTPSQVPNLYVGAQMSAGWHNILKWDNRHMDYRLHRLYI